MNDAPAHTGRKSKLFLPMRRLYALLAPRAYSVIIFGALFCNLAVKYFHARRVGLLEEYPSWIVDDVSVLLGIEVILALLCFRWPYKWLIRSANFFAALICTYSVINAGWLIRNGWQIVPAILKPLFRDPINALLLIGVGLAKSPTAAVVLLAPSAVALAFFFTVMAKPPAPNYNHKRFTIRITLSILIVFAAVLARAALAQHHAPKVISEGMRYNCQLRIVKSLFFHNSTSLTKTDLANAKRKIPAFDEIRISPPKRRLNHNVILVVLEGIPYRHTSLCPQDNLHRGGHNDLTPFIAALAQQGVEFTNTRSTLTHTTKVLFTILTGRFPSVSQDIVETVPAKKTYASIPIILKQNLNFRTAFFQSAKGNFESRPGLVYNLGFEKFWARDDLNSTDAYLGYLACDEFAMLEPIVQWITEDSSRPFFLTVMLSVTHDAYEFPLWFAEPAKDLFTRYKQAVSYTDKFLAALDVELAKLNLTNNTVFCVIGDHGEAFGEHGLLGHEKIAFDETVRIPFCLRAPHLISPGTKVTQSVSSVDFTPTLLALLGFETADVGFDGFNAFDPIPADRKAYFSGWLLESPAGFVKQNQKFIYYPANKFIPGEVGGTISAYDLSIDPLELSPLDLTKQQESDIAEDIIAWRKSTIFVPNQKRVGKKTIYNNWLCSWNNRASSVKRRKPSQR